MHEHGLLEADMIGPISNVDSLSMVLLLLWNFIFPRR